MINFSYLIRIERLTKEIKQEQNIICEIMHCVAGNAWGQYEANLEFELATQAGYQS